MNAFLAANSAGSAAGGIFLVISFLGFCVAFAWVIFPFIVISKCNQIIRLLAALQKTFDKNNDRQNETNKALQFFIDDRSKRP
jgi:hypothetical protein